MYHGQPPDTNGQQGERVLFLGGVAHGQHRLVSLDAHHWTVQDHQSDLSHSETMYTRWQIPMSVDKPPRYVCIAPSYRFDTVEWVQQLQPTVEQWEQLEPYFWRGQTTNNRRLYLLCDPDGRGYVGIPVTDSILQELPQARQDIQQDIRRQLQNELDYHRLPTCEAPGCGQKAPETFTALRTGYLAGKLRTADGTVHFCGRHSLEVRRTYHQPVDQIPAWLAADTHVDLLDVAWARYRLAKGQSPDQTPRGSILPLRDRHGTIWA